MAASHQLKKVSWWHQSIIDWMLENPDKLLGDCARHFNVTQSYLSVVVNSDAFRHVFNERRAEHNAGVSKSVIERVEELAGTALEVLNERIKAERDTVGLGATTDAAEMALKAMGFGAVKGGANVGGNQVNNTQNVFHFAGASKDTLEEARQSMRLLHGGTPPASILIENIPLPPESLSKETALIELKAFGKDEPTGSKVPTAP